METWKIFVLILAFRVIGQTLGPQLKLLWDSPEDLEWA